MFILKIKKPLQGGNWLVQGHWLYRKKGLYHNSLKFVSILPYYIEQQTLKNEYVKSLVL